MLERSFIPVRGVGEKTERALWDAGVTHWDAFTGEAVGPTTADRIEAFVDEATDQLSAGNADFFADAMPSNSRWRLYDSFRDDACFFDIETTGLDKRASDVTTVSFHQCGETTTLVRGRDLTARRLREQFADASVLVTFNGARFDVPFLEHAFDLSVERPHIDLMYPCKAMGLDGGLKRIERDVGIEREKPDISGRDAVRLWHEYERGDDGSLETLVEYNRDDARNLEPLMERVAAEMEARVFGDR